MNYRFIFNLLMSKYNVRCIKRGKFNEKRMKIYTQTFPGRIQRNAITSTMTIIDNEIINNGLLEDRHKNR